MYVGRGSLQLTISNDSKAFFKKLSRVWQNFKDYDYLQGISLSPDQISIIEQEEDQMLIEGYAGTGKSLTLIYKFINVLIREENQRVLFVTFNNTLIDDTEKRLNGSEEYRKNEGRHYTRIATFHEMATELLKTIKVIDKGIGKLTIDKVNHYRGNTYRRIAAILSEYKDVASLKYKSLTREERLYTTHDVNFITDEITWLKAMGLVKQDRYLTTERVGRSKSIRLTRVQRKTVFKIFEQYQKEMKEKYMNALDLEDYALKIIENSYLISEDLKFDYIFVDEVQDLDPMQIMALCMLSKKSIVLSGDAKQRIYNKTPLKYEDMGLNIKGKRKVLNKNFRSTAQIVRLANSIDFFDDEEKLMEKLFVKEGSRPIIHRSADNRNAVRYIANEIKKIHAEDPYKNIAIVHREEVKAKFGNEKSKFRNDLEVELFQTFSDINNYGIKFSYNEKKQIFYTNAYDVKGLEFDVVFIIDFNQNFYPHEKEIQAIKAQNEGKDIELINDDILEFINREKKLLYVAMTRAKEKLYIIANNCESERQISYFIHDFTPEDYEQSNFTKKEVEKLKVHHKHWLKSLLVKKDQGKENEKVIKFNIEELVKKSEISKAEVASDKQKMDTSTTVNNVSTQLEERPEGSKGDLIETIVKPLFEKHRLTFIDKRAKGGALWVVGGHELDDMMKRLDKGGIRFRYAPGGGKSTENKPAWFYTGK